jgi:hypothetical protein
MMCYAVFLEKTMKLEVMRDVKQKETIEIEFPYYYKHDLMMDDSDSVIYGKVEERRQTTIHLSYDYRSKERSFELEINDIHAAALACYMTDEHKSSEAEYLAAKAKMLAAAEAA